MDNVNSLESKAQMLMVNQLEAIQIAISVLYDLHDAVDPDDVTCEHCEDCKMYQCRHYLASALSSLHDDVEYLCNKYGA